ncbi:MAG: hypothetical protein KDC53_07075 [Saprospiraceae bacterium]|nr:hypothetical protein [Saprospiraceae bacterium]
MVGKNYHANEVRWTIFGLLLVLILLSCEQTYPAVHLTDEPFERLSEYHFFKDQLNQLSPNNRVLPYDLITPLFSDYALKSRFVWMPPGKTATVNDVNLLSFPEGTALIKNFYYPRMDSDHMNIVETRLLVKRSNGWDPLTYIWNEAQDEAFLEIAGDFKKITAQDPTGNSFTIDYAIPNKNQCKGCHERSRTVTPVGPTLKNLNRIYDYPEGSMNQLVKWKEVDYLTGYDMSRDTAKLADWSDPSTNVHDRALAYLEVNCGTCHHQEGPANVSGLRLDSHESNLFNLGVNKAPVSAGKGSGGRKYDIVPGKPDESILVYRMQSLEPGAMMPEMGRKLVHKEGVQLIRDWITSMPTTE